MFKKYKMAKNIHKAAVEAADKFYDFFKEASILDKCVKKDSFKVTSAIFIINVYRDALNYEYSPKDVFVMTTTAVRALATTKTAEEHFIEIYFACMKMYNEAIEHYKTRPGYNPLDFVVKIYFSMVIKDVEFLKAELENSEKQSSVFEFVHDYIDRDILGNK